MDIWGDHPGQCLVGDGVANTYCHNVGRDCLFRMARELAVSGQRESMLPVPLPDFESRRPD